MPPSPKTTKRFAGQGGVLCCEGGGLYREPRRQNIKLGRAPIAECKDQDTAKYFYCKAELRLDSTGARRGSTSVP